MKRRSFFQILLGSSIASRFLPFSIVAAEPSVAQQGLSTPPPTGPFSLPPLPYAPNALEPYIDAETMTLHHDKHHAAYVNNLNKAIAPYPDLQKKSLEELLGNLDAVPAEIRTTVRNNAGGHSNHSILWKTLSNPGKKPEGKLAKEIMVAARGHGLHTCPQAAWNGFAKIILPHIGAGEEEMLVCGMALGYADPSALVNSFHTPRESASQFTHFVA